MAETRSPGRRSFVGSLGWVLGAVGIGGAGYALLRSTQPVGYDPRMRVDLPETPDGYYRQVAVQDQPVALVGLSAQQAADLHLAPGQPPFVIRTMLCTYDRAVLSHMPGGQAEWTCPKCATAYALDGRALGGPPRRKRDLAVPPYSFIGRRAVLIGKPFVAT